MAMIPATDVSIILGTYYKDVTTELYPDFYTNPETRERLIPYGYDKYYKVLGVYEAKDHVYDILANENLQEVLLIHVSSSIMTGDMIAMEIDNKLYDVLDDIMKVLATSENSEDDDEEDEVITQDDGYGQVEDWSEDGMIAYGQEIYDAYGSEVDTQDMTEYEAACYLAYKRSIGEV